jgi:hypothetical protein
MFKGLQQILHKSKPGGAAARHPQIEAVQTAELLLAAEKRQQHLKSIKSLLNLSPKTYDQLYHKAIAGLTEFAQNLPQTQYGVYSHTGGFVDHAIERAARALSLCLNYFFPQQSNFQKATSLEALWIYAVFTAALFLDLGRLAVKCKITLCHKDGSAVKEWLPYAGSMTQQAGDYYKYDFHKENRDNLAKLVTSSIARQILDAAMSDDKAENTNDKSSSGFAWLASDPDVLEAWLSMLNTEGRPMGGFMTVIPLADAQVIENYFNLQKPAHGKPFAGTLFDSPLNTTGLIDAAGEPSPTHAGEAFLHWLREGLANGSISINELAAHVQVVREGVLLAAGIFKIFSAAHPQHGNADGIARQFTRMLDSYIKSIGEMGGDYNLIGGELLNKKQEWLLINKRDLLIGRSVPINSNLVRVSAQEQSAAAAQTATQSRTPATNRPQNRY